MPAPSVLIVDDDPDIREALGDMLGHEGYRVHAVAYGSEAIQQVRQTRFGAIVLDIQLPDLDGLSVLKALMEMDPKLPILILTGYATLENTVGALVKGAFAYLTKPYNQEEIKATLRRAIEVNSLAVEAKHVAHALSESEERFRAVVESASDAIVLADSSGAIISWNKSAQALFSYTEKEVLGQPMAMIMPERYRARHEQGLKRLKETGQARLIGKTVELDGLRKDGTEFPLELSLSTWKTIAGTFYSGIIRDITERKRDNERLAKINECLLSFGKDPNENINRLTALCGELLGGTCAVYSYLDGGLLHSIGRWRTSPNFNPVDKPDGHLCADVIKRGGTDVVVVRNLPKTPYAQTDPNVIPYRLQTYVGRAIRRDGCYVGALCVLYQKDFVPSEGDQRIMGIIASAIGVEEERKKADLALRQAYDETEKILASLPGAILIVNEVERVVYANSLACQYFGGGREVMVGSSLAEILPLQEVRRSRLRLSLKPYSAEQGYWQQDHEFELEKRMYRYRLFPVAIRGSERLQTGLVIWDVTEEKQLQDQLAQAEKLASLGTMVSGMAHEINNPAQAILSMAEIIMEEQDPEKVKEYAQDIVGYAKHVSTVVRDFATYARSASHDQPIEIDVRERLTEAVKMIRRCPQFGRVEVETQFQPIPRFLARQAEIDQVFINLISNAVQAMHGTGRLTLATKLQVGVITVSISDTGHGIPKALLHRIFDPFFTTKDPGKGTGLGLSIVYKIVAKYGGQISVESEQGQGTTFILQFPVQIQPRINQEAPNV